MRVRKAWLLILLSVDVGMGMRNSERAYIGRATEAILSTFIEYTLIV